MNDRFIEQLVADLEPAPRLKNARLWMYGSFCLFLIAAMILGFMGLRTDFVHAFQTGAMFWKPAIFLLIWLGSVMLITDISRPAGHFRKWHFLPVISGMALLLWQGVSQGLEHPLHERMESLRDSSAIVCLATLFVCGTIAMVLGWKYWSAKTASHYPGILGALSGLSAGSLAAAAYALHCDKDSALYITAYYGMPLLALSLFGYGAGKRLLRW